MFETLTLFGIVIIVCAVCLCAHYVKIIADRGEDKRGGGYAKK